MTQRCQLIRAAASLSESVAMFMMARLLLLASVASQLRPGDTSSPLSLLLDLKDRIFSFSDTPTTVLDQENLGNNSVAEPLFNETEYENSTVDSEAVQGTRSDLETRENGTDSERLAEINEQDALERISASLNDTNTNESQYEYDKEQELNYTSYQEINYGKTFIGNSEMITEATNIQREQETNTTLLSDILTDSLSLTTKNDTKQKVKPKDSFDTGNIQITTTINASSIEENKQLDLMSGNVSLDLSEFVNTELTEATNSQSYVPNMTEMSANNVTQLFFLNATNLNVPNVSVTGQQIRDQSSLSNTSPFESKMLHISNETKKSTITSSSNGSDKNETNMNEKPIPDNDSQVSNETTKNISNLPSLVNVLSNSTQIVERFIENITDSLATLNPEIETILNTANVEGITRALIESNFTTFLTQTLNTSTTVQSASNKTHINSRVGENTDKNVNLGNFSSEFITGTENGSNRDRIKRSINLTFSWDEESETDNSVNTVSATSTDLVFKASLNLTDQLDKNGWNNSTNRPDYVCRAHDDEVVLHADLNTTSKPTMESGIVEKPAVTQVH